MKPKRWDEIVAVIDREIIQKEAPARRTLAQVWLAHLSSYPLENGQLLEDVDGERLGVCIAIDLKSGVVPSEKYIELVEQLSSPIRSGRRALSTRTSSWTMKRRDSPKRIRTTVTTRGIRHHQSSTVKR